MVNSKAIRDLPLAALSQGLSIASLFFVQLYSARVLGLKVFGELAVLQSYFAIIESLVISSFGEVCVYYVGHLWGQAKQKFLTQILAITKLSLIAAVVVCSSFSILLFIFQPETNRALFSLFIANIFFQTSFPASKAILTRFHKIALISRIEIYYSLLLSFFSLIFISLFGSLGLATAILLSSLFKAISFLIYSTRLFESEYLHHSPEYSINKTISNQEILNIYIVSALRNVLQSATNQLDIIIVSAIKGPQIAGIYKTAKSFAKLPLVASAPIWKIMLPNIMILYNKPGSDLKDYLEKPVIGMLLAIFFLLPVYFIFAPSIISALYGSSFVEAGRISTMLLFGYWCFYGAFGWFNIYAAITHAKRIILFIHTSLFISTVFSTLFLASGGLLNVAISSTIIHIALSLFCSRILL